jgi:hypothetical protein
LGPEKPKLTLDLRRIDRFGGRSASKVFGHDQIARRDPCAIANVRLINSSPAHDRDQRTPTRETAGQIAKGSGTQEEFAPHQSSRQRAKHQAREQKFLHFSPVSER